MVGASITVLDRGRIRTDANYLVEGHTLATRTNQNPDIAYVEIPVLSFIIDHPEGTILWDTGSHHDAGSGHWPDDIYDAFHHYDAHEHRLDDDLDDAGYGIDDIDYVFQSHLHLDHAGGLPFFDGTETPIFVHEAELKYAYYSANTTAGNAQPSYLLDDFDYELNWEVLHQRRETYFEGIEFIHLPGHTPGFVGTVIHLDDPGSIILAGDVVFQQENYVDEVPLGAFLLWDSGRWFESLQTVKRLEREHDAQAVVFGHEADQLDEFGDGWP